MKPQAIASACCQIFCGLTLTICGVIVHHYWDANSFGLASGVDVLIGVASLTNGFRCLNK